MCMCDVLERESCGEREREREREMGKNECRAKSGRKPLKDVTNGTKLSKAAKKKSSESEDRSEDEGLDRLLLVQSDLSALIHQIDELVVQAFKLKATGKQGRKEIQSFTNALSEIHSSLKPWVPRFQKALSSPSMDSDNQVGQSLACKSCPAVKEDISIVVDSPIKTKVDSLVSPSPLVSWRANCTVERGRQMFMLTPVPISKGLSSKRHDSSKSFLERITSNTTGGLPSFFSILGDTNDDLLEGVSVMPTPCKTLNTAATETGSTLEHGLVSPSKFSKRDHSMLVMTPCLKRSPPRSCVLLEPISEFSPQDKDRYRKSTPFPVGIQSSDGSEFSSSSSQASENLALKYPELIGIQPGHKLGIGKKKVEESLDWFMSPPKTCVLMEPPKEKSLNNALSMYQLPKTTGVSNQQKNLSSTKDNAFQGNRGLSKISCNQELHDSSFALAEVTPMWKEPQSTIRTGKRPGENTLKKELWTKFEAATVYPLHLDFSVPDTAQKVFLERLDEVSCHEASSVDEDRR